MIRVGQTMASSLLRSKLLFATGLSCACAVGAAAAYSTKPQTQAEKKLPKLYYFNIAGRAFPIRAALRHAKLEFEE